MSKMVGKSFTAGAFLFVCGAILAGFVQAQEQKGGRPKPEAQIAAIARLDYMVGDWSGEGWMDFGGNRVTFRGTERIQKKLDGTVLLVEGHFLAKPPGAEAKVPVHSTLGVISFEPQAKKYQFASWLATGSSGERELTLDSAGWRWQMESPRGTIRYIMKLTDAGAWFEIGERSSDGTNWQKFFEMTLRKK